MTETTHESPHPRYGEVVHCPGKQSPCGSRGVVHRRFMLKPLGFVPYYYCGRHGNWVFVDGRWWFFSAFRPGLLIEEGALAPCPVLCWNSGDLDAPKQVHRGRDGRFHCSHCSWSGDTLPETVR